jgi:hypothetical protein
MDGWMGRMAPRDTQTWRAVVDAVRRDRSGFELYRGEWFTLKDISAFLSDFDDQTFAAELTSAGFHTIMHPLHATERHSATVPKSAYVSTGWATDFCLPVLSPP